MKDSHTKLHRHQAYLTQSKGCASLYLHRTGLRRCLICQRNQEEDRQEGVDLLVYIYNPSGAVVLMLFRI